MYIHSFRLIVSRKLLEAQLFNQQYQNYEDIPNVQDRLRWCRHHMGLMQKEVADLIGISRGHYIDFEVGYVDYYPKEIVDKLANVANAQQCVPMVSLSVTCTTFSLVSYLQSILISAT